jgi:hypothetical protein
MATEVRSCPRCGNSLTIAGQRFCPVCGLPVPAAEVPNVPVAEETAAPAAPAALEAAVTLPVAVPVVPAPADPPPAVAALAVPQFPSAGTDAYPAPAALPTMPPAAYPGQPSYAAAPPPGSQPVPQPPAAYPAQAPYASAPQYTAAPPPAMYGQAPVPPAAPGAGGAMGDMLARLPIPLPAAIGIAAVALVAIVAVVMLGGNRPGITYNPSTISCTGETLSLTMRLPSSVLATDTLALTVDGSIWPPNVTWTAPAAGFVKQSDGSWVFNGQSATPNASECGLVAGTHQFAVINVAGQAVAQGSLTRR